MSAHGPPEECAVNHTLERRTFLKAAGAATGFLIAQSHTAFSYAQNSKIRIGCIGVGAQGLRNMREGLTHTPDAQIVAIADVYKPSQDAAINAARLSNAKQHIPEGQVPTTEQMAAANATRTPTVSYDYREVLANPNVDAVIIATPPAAQFAIVTDALNAGKYVFCETPLVRSIEQGRCLVEQCHKLERWVQVGYQHRYNPKYNLAQSLVYDSRMLGRITHISAQSHANSSERRPLPEGYVLNDEERKHITDLDRHLNWRLYGDQSRGLYIGAALHHLDTANWFLRSVPSCVFASGGPDYWHDGRTNDDNMVVVCEYDLKPSAPGHKKMKSRTTLMSETTANQTYTVRFVHSSVLNTGTRGECQIVHGDRGSLVLGHTRCLYQQEPWAVAEGYEPPFREEEVSGAIRPTVEKKPEDVRRFATGCSKCPPLFRPLHSAPIPLLGACDDLDPEKNPSASATAFQFRAFAECIREGRKPRNNEMVAFTSAASAVAALESRRRGQAIQVDPEWFAFDFDPPSAHEYDPSWDTKECDPPKCECCGQPKKYPSNPACPICGRDIPRQPSPCPC